MSSTLTKLEYFDGDTLCKGEYFTPVNKTGPLPVILVCHAWDGLVQEVRDKCEKLVDAGYIAFAVDVYGEGKTLSDMADMAATVEPLMVNRQVLLDRLEAAVTAAKTIPSADISKIAAMGYCFGGLCVLDLARGGTTDVKAVVSFHGALLPNGLTNEKAISAKILALHGNDDPMIPPEQVEAFMTEMTEKNVDWQFVSYSNTVHAFTRPDANEPSIGALYNAKSDQRSWQSMLNFFTETL